MEKSSDLLYFNITLLSRMQKVRCGKTNLRRLAAHIQKRNSKNGF